ncbi:MAG: hypothetical protein PHE12_04470 [Clostridia bacterium]|nr:hypothetical protein [Clostridia bacterium]
METEIIINKVVITEEAKFDYENIIGDMPMPRTEIKNECEYYINNFDKLNRYYLRINYYDNVFDKMLMFFFFKGDKFGLMQIWELRGICFAEDWTEDIEDEGLIKSWLDTKIDLMFANKNDWVLELRESERRKEAGMPCYRLIGLPKEVENAIYNGTDKEVFEKLSHLQRKGGNWVGYRRYFPKPRKSRKMHKRT